jgi:hypothetical protein
VLGVRKEQVPQAFGARPLADLDHDLRVGAAGVDGHLGVERAQRFGLDRVDVLVHERPHAIAKLGDARAQVEVHERSLTAADAR